MILVGGLWDSKVRRPQVVNSETWQICHSNSFRVSTCLYLLESIRTTR